MFRNILHPQQHQHQTLLMLILYTALVLYLLFFGATAAGALL